MADDNIKLQIEISARNNTQQALDEAIRAAEGAGDAFSKAFSVSEASSLKALGVFESQARAADLVKQITIDTLSGRARENALLDQTIEGLREKASALEREGAKVDEVRAATERLKTAQAERFNSQDQQRALELAGQARELESQLQIAGLSGADRQAAADQAAIQSIQRRIDAMRAEGTEVTSLQRALSQLQAVQAQRTANAGAQQEAALTGRVAVLDLQQIENERQLAIASKDRQGFEEKTAQLIEARGRIAQDAASREIAAIREQFKGRTDLNALLDHAERSIRTNADLQSKLGAQQLTRGAGLELGGGAFAVAGRVRDLGRDIASQLGPAGPILGEVAAQATRLGGGLEGVIEKSSLSAAALGGIGLAVTGILAVGRALESVGKDSERLEAILGDTAARTSELIGYQERLNELKEKARGLAASTGLPQDDIGAALAVVEASGRNLEQQQRLIEAAIKASTAHQGPAAGVAQGISRAQLAFKEEGRDPSEIANDIFVVAQTSRKSFIDLQGVLGETGVIARNSGLSMRDTLAVIGSAARRSGEDVDVLRLGLGTALRLVGPEGGEAHDILEKLGVDFSNAGKGGSSLVDVFEQMRAKIDSLPDPQRILSQLGDSKTARALQAILRATAQDVRETNVQFELARQNLDAIFESAGNDASAKLARSSQTISNNFQATFDTVKEGWALLFGKDLRVPTDVQFPEEIAGLAKSVQDALKAGDSSAARDRLAELKNAARQGAQAYSDEFRKAQKEDLSRQQSDFLTHQALNTNPRATRSGLAGFTPTPFAPRFTISDFAQSLSSVTGQLESAVNAATKDVSAKANPIELALKLKQARADALEGDIQQALKLIDLPILGVPVMALPPDVAAARAELQRIQNDFATYNQVLPPDQGKATTDIALLQRYRGELLQVGQTADSIHIGTLFGFDKQAAQFDQAEASLKRLIAEYRGGAEGLKVYQSALAELQQAHSTELDKSDQGKRAELDVKRLEVQAQSLEKARDLARANGDIANGDALATAAIDARYAATKRANELALQGIRDSARGYSGVAAVIDTITRALGENAAADRTVAQINNTRAIQERNLASAAFAQDASDALLTGLDRELAAIRRNRAEAEKSDRAALASGKLLLADFTSAQKSRDAQADRDTALARRNADLSGVDAISSALAGVTNSYTDQQAAIDLTRAAEKLRFEESLANSGAEKDVVDQLTAAFDEQTRAKKRQAAIGFATTSASSLAERDLLDNAAIAGQNLSLQDQINLISEAKSGVDAWSKGWQSGTTDALRSLNDFDAGVQGSHDLIIGFRDSVVGIFDDIAQGGKNPLQGFLKANLQNIEKVAATSFSNQLTLGIFGKPDANQADPFSASSASLNLAGIHLLTAAAALQASAIGLGGSGIANSLNNVLSNSLAAGTDTAGTHLLGYSEGGVFGGVPIRSHGLSPKANRVGGVYGSRTLIEVAEVPGMKEAVIPLAGGKIPVDLRDSGAGARQRVYDSAPSRVVNVDSSSKVGEIHLHVNVDGGSGPVDGEKLARQMAPHILNVVSSALESGSSRRAVEAVRGAAGR